MPADLSRTKIFNTQWACRWLLSLALGLLLTRRAAAVSPSLTPAPPPPPAQSPTPSQLLSPSPSTSQLPQPTPKPSPTRVPLFKWPDLSRGPSPTPTPPIPPPKLPIKIHLQQNPESDNLSIYIGINGHPPIAYLFDTGSDALVVAGSAFHRQKIDSISGSKKPDSYLYGDGTYGYYYFPVMAHLAFYNPQAARPALVPPAPEGYVVGRIVEQVFDLEPKKHINDTSKVVTDTGVFGARMFAAAVDDDAPDGYQLANTLYQIPGVQGIVVTDNGPPGTASVTVGLNQAIRDQFKQKITLTPNGGHFSHSNLQSCDEAVVNLTFSLEGEKPVTISTVLGLDTGSGTGYHAGFTAATAKVLAPYLVDSLSSVEHDKASKENKIVKAGTTLTFSFPGRPDGWRYTFRSSRSTARGGNTGFIPVTSLSNGYNDITAGISFFEHFAVLYDMEKGELGLRDKPPDLSPAILHPEEQQQQKIAPKNLAGGPHG